MLPLLHENLRGKNLRDCWISFRDIDGQRVLHYDWRTGTNGHKHPTKSSSLKYYLSLMIISKQKNLRYLLIPSRYTDHQRMLQSDWLTAF